MKSIEAEAIESVKLNCANKHLVVHLKSGKIVFLELDPNVKHQIDKNFARECIPYSCSLAKREGNRCNCNECKNTLYRYEFYCNSIEYIPNPNRPKKSVKAPIGTVKMIYLKKLPLKSTDNAEILEPNFTFEQS